MAGRVLLVTSLLAGCQLLLPAQEAGGEVRSETSAISLLLRARKQAYAQGSARAPKSQRVWRLQFSYSCRESGGRGSTPKPVHHCCSQALFLNPFHDDHIKSQPI